MLNKKTCHQFPSNPAPTHPAPSRPTSGTYDEVPRDVHIQQWEDELTETTRDAKVPLLLIRRRWDCLYLLSQLFLTASRPNLVNTYYISNYSEREKREIHSKTTSRFDCRSN